MGFIRVTYMKYEQEVTSKNRNDSNISSSAKADSNRNNSS